MSANASTYTKSVLPGGYANTNFASTTVDSYKLSQIASHEYDKKTDYTWSETVATTVVSSESSSLAAAISSTVGAEIDVFGSKASVSLTASINRTLGTSSSVSKYCSESISISFNKNKHRKGIYAFEQKIKGYSTCIKYVKVNTRTGKKMQNDRQNDISYLPRAKYTATSQMKIYDKDPEKMGVYDKVYFK